LTAAIRALKSGDFQASLPANTYDEFREVNNAFNTATEEIKALKIDMYEERLNKQKIQMQYLQMQVAPHFLINCLNTVYQLTDMNQQELTRTMLRTLSRHLRYTLSSGKTVSLKEELTHVENYIELSSVRYPDSIVLIKEYDPAALNAVAIPLLILNFVENTIKFEATLGKCLEIHISARLLAESSNPRVHIQIWDTGGGFSKEILEELIDIPAYIRKHQDQHIGISNVFQRASIVFDDCRFQFCNRAGSGAQIDIKIPYLPFSPKEGSA
jgi:two-component system sensor histidine kinase YesM